MQEERWQRSRLPVVLRNHKDPLGKRPAAQEEEKAVRWALKLGDPRGNEGARGRLQTAAAQAFCCSAAHHAHQTATYTKPPHHLGNMGSAGQPRSF